MVKVSLRLCHMALLAGDSTCKYKSLLPQLFLCGMLSAKDQQAQRVIVCLMSMLMVKGEGSQNLLNPYQPQDLNGVLTTAQL